MPVFVRSVSLRGVCAWQLACAAFSGFCLANVVCTRDGGDARFNKDAFTSVASVVI